MYQGLTQHNTLCGCYIGGGVVGSSFPLIASLVSPRPVMLVSVTKRASRQAFYDMSDDVRIDSDGNIMGQSLDQVRDLIVSRYDRYHRDMTTTALTTDK